MSGIKKEVKKSEFIDKLDIFGEVKSVVYGPGYWDVTYEDAEQASIACESLEGFLLLDVPLTAKSLSENVKSERPKDIRSKDVCRNCKKQGHYAKDCPAKE